ncbi:MAG: hypothetical protein HYV33_01375 [Candidatus Kerfeldbacteria bacterium]|nr:hypothetical protein [Candidatus Kerfeldbacteria bacterium]
MGTVDFLKPGQTGDTTPPSQRSKNYDIEYTNPTANSATGTGRKKTKVGPAKTQDPVLNINLTPTTVAAQPPIAPPPPPQPVPVPLAQPQAPLPPVTPPPPPAQPVAPQPSRPATSSIHAPTQNGDVVHAQNVEHVKGETTNPVRQASDVFNLNLLPTTAQRDHGPRAKATSLLKLALITSTVIGLLYTGMVGYESYYIIQTRSNVVEIERFDHTIAQYTTLQSTIQQTDQTITNLGQIIDEHIYWTNILTLLEQYTLPNVSYTSFSGSVTGDINLQARTTDFKSVSQQVAAFRLAGTLVDDVTVTTATQETIADKVTEEADTNKTVDNQTVSFTISLKLNPNSLHYGIQ